MDLFERLSRMMRRRKYARMDDRRAPPCPLMSKSKSAKVPIPSAAAKEEAKKLERASSCSRSRGREARMPKRFTLRSTEDDVIDGAWFNDALRRSVAEGRVNLSTIGR